MYIDLFVIQSLIFDYLILSGVAILLDEKLAYHRLLGGLAINLLLSVVLTLLGFPSLILLVPIVVIRIVFANQNKKRYLKRVIYFYSLTMFLSGMIYTLRQFIQFGMEVVPYILVALGLSFLITLGYVLKMRWVNDQQIINQFTHEVRVFCGGTEIKGMGFVDTGNHLIDQKTSNPVMMIPKGKLGAYSIDEFLQQHRLASWETTYSVINDESQSLKVFKPTLLIINGTIVQNVVVGIVENSFHEYDFLLQPNIVKNV